MIQRNKSWYFKQNPFIQGFAATDLERLEAISESVTLRRRQVLWGPGDSPTRVYLVVSGIVKISRVTGEGREITLHLVRRNELLGETAIVSPGPQNTTAEAYDEAVLYAVPVKEFLRLMQENPSLFFAVTRLITERRRSLESRIEALLFKTAHARLASLFLELAERFGVRDARGVIINLKLTHREMASLIGASRETVSFAILDLRNDNLVITEDKRVVLIDEGKLKALAAS